MTLERLTGRFGPRPMAGDAIGAVLMALLSTLPLPALLGERGVVGPRLLPHNAVGALFVVAWTFAYAVPLLWRRTRPALACTLLAIPHLVQLAAFPFILPQNISVLVMEFAIAAYGSRRARRLWLILGLAASLAASFSWTEEYRVNYATNDNAQLYVLLVLLIALVVSIIASWLLGALARERLLTVRTLRDRAKALAAERDRFAQLAAEQERSRIAREMHDVVAHSLSVIVVQTDGASYALDQPGDAAAKLELAREALARIASTSREALRETRALVGVLREGEAPEMAPQPLLDEVDELIESTRVSGLDIDYAVDGSPEAHAPLGPARETAAYRIVQESLTNVIKHAGPGAHAWVHLTHSGTGLMISIRDDGNGADADDGHGHGLIGMRERVAPFGGTLAARPRLDGGFEVLAIIPVDEDGPPSDRRTGAEGPGAPAPLSRITDLTRNNS